MKDYQDKKIIKPPINVPEWIAPDAIEWQNDIKRSLSDNLIYRPPLFASVVITSKCNSKCVYCPYAADAPIAKSKDMDESDLYSVIDQLADLGVKRVQLAGGEPLMVEYLEVLIRYASSKGLGISLVSNGLLLEPKRFKELLEAGLEALVISCDDLPIHGETNLRGKAFPEAIKWLKRFSSPDIWLGANITLTNSNQDRIVEIATMLRSYGLIPQVQPLHIFEEVPLSAQYLPDSHKLKDQIEKWISLSVLNNSPFYLSNIPNSLDAMIRKPLQCLIPWKHILIDYHGNIFFCCRTNKIGHIHSGIKSAWEGELAANIRDAIKQGCRACWLGLVDFWK